ncbi:hypothetical protein ACJX0J_032593, partial [Zea mays]
MLKLERDIILQFIHAHYTKKSVDIIQESLTKLVVKTTCLKIIQIILANSIIRHELHVQHKPLHFFSYLYITVQNHNLSRSAFNKHLDHQIWVSFLDLSVDHIHHFVKDSTTKIAEELTPNDIECLGIFIWAKPICYVNFEAQAAIVAFNASFKEPNYDWLDH